MKLRTIIQRLFPALILVAALMAAPPGTDAKTKQPVKKTEKSEGRPELQRVPNQLLQNVKNKVSNVDFYMSNYGIFGNNIAGGVAGGIWPRGSSNAYIFGGGIWFGARKRLAGDTTPVKLSVISYNPNSGSSWFVPGPFRGVGSSDDNKDVNKYRVYFSTDYNELDGEPTDKTDDRQGGVNWPIWDSSPVDSLRTNRYFGLYEDDTTRRHLDIYPKGPAVISGEDIFSVFNDGDITKYEGEAKAGSGLPFGLQVENTVYSWGIGNVQTQSSSAKDMDGDYRDILFLKYVIINRSADTLYDCYAAPAMDMDIGNAANDHAKIAIALKEEDSLNLAVQWSESEANGTFGYIGFDFLESPAVDTLTGFLRKDKRYFERAEQVGLTTFQNWPITVDPKSPTERYDFMAEGQRDGDDQAGDKRFLMATGPFHMRPGDTARVTVGIMFAYGATAVPNGTWTDMSKLLALDAFAQKVYDSNFVAPKPPDRPKVTWRPLNGGIELRWDSTAENSYDPYEDGLDLLGYTIQRVRRYSLKFVPRDTVQGWNLSWKTIARIQIPPIPDSATRYAAARTNNRSLLGAWWRVPMLADTCPGGGLVGKYPVYRWDTLNRPGLSDTIVRGPKIRDANVFCFAFNPYDDRNPDSSTYAARMTEIGYTGSMTIRAITRAAIEAIMDSITNGHRFIDVGDDNRDGTIVDNPTDLSQNERLINNVDYFYQVLPFDEGSVVQRTVSKPNSGVLDKNQVLTSPEAPPPSRDVTPEKLSESGLGGITNFQLMVLDKFRMAQMFGGDTLEFEFRPVDRYPLADYYTGATLVYPAQLYFYNNEVVVHSRRTGTDVTRFFVGYDIGNRFKFSDRAIFLDSNLQTRFTVDANGDTVSVPPTDSNVVYNGTFVAQANQPVFGTSGVYRSTFGISFDYNFTQGSDSLRFGRGDTASRYAPFTKQTASDVNLIPLRQYESFGTSFPGTSIPSIGRVKVQVEFTAGGTESLTFTNLAGRTFYFPDVPYLNVLVSNVATYNKQVIDPVTGQTKTETIQYNHPFPQEPNIGIYGDTATTAEELVRLINVGNSALYAYGWVNAVNIARNNPIQRGRVAAQTPQRPIGTPGRYYQGTVYGYHLDSSGARIADTLQFTHRLIVNGADILIDFAGMGSVDATVPKPIRFLPAVRPTVDLQAGDKFTVDFAGGTAGLPAPGAKVVYAIPDPQPAMTGEVRAYTNDELEQIQIVPNPYLVSHIGERASSENLLYFTRLPESCTIRIYTESGELLQTIEHQANPNGRRAVNAWDLVTKGSRKAVSQLLIARITTPSGAEVVKKFAVVVGGFRIVQ